MAVPIEKLISSRRKFLGVSFGSMLSVVIGSIRSVVAESVYHIKDASADLEKIRLLLASDDPHVWLFTGDSITHGAKHTHGLRSYPEIFSERIRWELKRVRDVIINTGISGNTTNNLLNDFEWRVRGFKPSLVSVMLGTNDCARKEIPPSVFENNLRLIIGKIRETGAVPILHTPNTIITAKSPERASLSQYVPVIRNVSERNGVILVDHYRYWEDTAKNTSGINVQHEWLNDPLHPNGKGHQELARLTFKTLSIFDPKDPTCGAEYYEGEH
jgi:acyl-CoA thioesterase I